MLQIDKEREGEQIDRSLLKNVLDIFVEIGMGEMGQYEQDFEVHMLEDTADYYKSKAANLIEIDSSQIICLRQVCLYCALRV